MLVDSLLVTSSSSQEGRALSLSTNGSGTIIADPELDRYPPGTTVSLTAVPGSNGAFSGWSGDASGRANPISVTMDRDREVTASFDRSGSDASVTVIIQPAGAVAAGAQWRYRDGPWMDSGTTRELNLPGPGSSANVQVYYKDVPGWETPRRKSFLLPFGENRTVLSDPYVQDDVPTSSTGYLVGTNPDEYDYFGSRVSVEGDWAVTTTSNDGKVHTYRKEDSGWLETVRLEPGDFSWADRFEGDVEQWNGWLAIGAPYEGEERNSITGAVHILSRANPGWAYETTLSSSVPATSLFGDQFALDSNVLAVSEQWADVSGLDKAGALSVFEWNGQSWGSTARITHPEPVAQGQFGEHVATDGTILLVSSRRYSGGPGSSGAVYVYRRNGAEWELEDRFTSPTGAADDRFGASGSSWGSSIAVSGDRIAVGVAYADPGGVSDAGAVYLYEYDSGNWSQDVEVSASDPFAGDRFGGALDLDGGVLVVGARGKDAVGSGSGGAYVYREVDGTWLETSALQPNPAVSGAGFGSSVSLDGERVLVGAPRDPVGGVLDRGSASVFDLAYNYPASSPSITSPSGGFHLDVNVGGEPLDVTWTTSVDPEGGSVDYQWLLAERADSFGSP